MIRPSRSYRPGNLRPEHRTETVTVEVGRVNGTAVQVTYTIEVTVWTGPGGPGGFISARPREISLSDSNSLKKATLPL